MSIMATLRRFDMVRLQERGLLKAYMSNLRLLVSGWF